MEGAARNPEKQLEDTFNISLDKIGDSYGKLRIINPAAEESFFKLIKKYGQLSPVVVSRLDGRRYELIDGFKRLRAIRRLNTVKSLKAKLLNAGIHASKAAIVQLNNSAKSISGIEEALVVHSLYREDGLTQLEIGSLLSRHKSWVCRRISMIEGLCEEVQCSIKLGLTSTTIGLELAKLHRCNQEAALSTIQRHKLTRRETQKLVSALLSHPKYDHERLLRNPEEILKDLNPRAKYPKDKRLSGAGNIIIQKLALMENSCLNAIQSVSAKGLSELTEADILSLSPAIGQTIRAAELAADRLKKILTSQNPFENSKQPTHKGDRQEEHAPFYS